LGNPPVPILKPYDYIDEADYVIIESAYGDRNQEPRQNRKAIIEDAIEDTVKSGGTMMIPAFAMERTQEVLYEINDLIENHRVPRVPIFLDSPLAIKATEVFKKFEHYFNQETRGIINSGDDIFNFPGLEITRTSQQSKKINDVPAPKIIIAGSGMSTGGRILFHEKFYLPDPKSMLFIVGYQVKGTLGRRLLDGENFVNILGQRVEVNARIKACGAFSAHADQRKLLNWVKHIKSPVKKVFVVQGEDKPASILAEKIKHDLSIDAIAPDLGYSIEI
jgi:metallo-beta-lactamase family protein